MPLCDPAQVFPCTATGTALTPEQVAEMTPTTEDLAMAEAQALATPALLAKVQAASDTLQDAIKLGVDFDLTAGVPGFKALRLAFSEAESLAQTVGSRQLIVTARLNLRDAWDDYAYNFDSAYDMFPYLYAIMNQ
jgi:hypothetical protein